MDNENRLRELVMYKTIEYNIGDFEQLRAKTQEQLMQIENSFQKYLEEQSKTAEKIKELGKLNLLMISNQSGVQRSTVYHNENTLKKYIEERIEEIKSEDFLQIEKLKRLQADNQRLRTYLENLQYHLIENELLEKKIRELEIEVQDLYNKNEALQEQTFKLQDENNHLRQELKKNPNTKKVVPLAAGQSK
jgi:hypothetical protein